MAMQRSADGKTAAVDGKTAARDGKAAAIDGKAAARDDSADQPDRKAGTGFGVGWDVATGQANSGAAARIVARLAAALSLVGSLLLEGIARIASVQSRAGRRKQMKLVESLPLGNRRQLLLIECGNQRYLVGAGADSVGSILAMGQDTATGDLGARGPVLVRRGGSDTTAKLQRSNALTEAGPNPWR